MWNVVSRIENLECRIEKYRRKKGRIMKKTGEKE
jgi:hypothetical protein